MIDSKDYVVDLAKWDVARQRRYPELQQPNGEAWEAFRKVLNEWNLRTSGAGCVYLTLLYALRAHKRGRTHCHDMDYAQQGEWLKKAEPFLSQFLEEREEINTTRVVTSPQSATA